MQCVAACCSETLYLSFCVLQCALVRFSVLQCVAVCCSMLQCVAVRHCFCHSDSSFDELQCILQCVAVCFSVMQLDIVPATWTRHLIFHKCRRDLLGSALLVRLVGTRVRQHKRNKGNTILKSHLATEM